ncbi:MAG: hypothetical protein H6510_13680 [Acidobacteria bacterium]|nr:hypothetical protein [Acidobacteriota bacterium]MCB9398858.1 hypothetical protein [Acidobacteriota bacterium]
MEFIAVLIGCLNAILLASVIYILKQPNPSEGREIAEIMDVKKSIEEMHKNLIALEKRVDQTIRESKTESLARIDTVRSEVSKQLREIHDNL